MIKFLNSIFIFFFVFLSPTTFAKGFGLESSSIFTQEVKALFYENGSPSMIKMEQVKKEINKMIKEEVRFLVENMTSDEGLTIENATKMAYKDKKIQAFNWLLENIDEIPNALSINEQETRLKNITKIFVSLKRGSKGPFITNVIEGLGSIIFKGHNVPLKDLKRIMPSNLGNERENRYYTKDELRQMVKRGEDISLIDPVAPTFWNRPKDISTQVASPAALLKHKIPQVVYYKHMILRESQPKMRVSEHLPNGKKRDWKLKVGREVNTEVFISHFMKMLGYFADNDYYQANVKVYFKNKKAYQTFLLDWMSRFNTNDDVVPSKFIKETGEDSQGFYAILYEALLESRTKKSLRIGQVHLNKYGNWDRREIRALLLAFAFVSNNDITPSRNNRVKLIKKGKSALDWEVREMVHDFGFGFGSHVARNAPNEYKWSFLKRSLGKLKINYRNVNFISKKQNPLQQATYSDLKWMARLMVQLRREQFETLSKYSGWPEPVRVLFMEKMVKRRNEIVKAFELVGETIKGRTVKLWPEVKPKRFSYGKWIKKGKLLKGYKAEGSPLNYTPTIFANPQMANLAKMLIGPILKATESLPYYRIISFPQTYSSFNVSQFVPGVGIGFRLKRTIELNKNAKDPAKAWITHDVLKIFGNVGMLAYLPINPNFRGKLEAQALIGKEFSVAYYSPSAIKAIMGNAKLLARLAFKKREIIAELDKGLYYTDGLFVGIEFEEGIQTSDLVGPGFDFGQKFIFLNLTEVKRREDGGFDVSKIKAKGFSFTFDAYIRLFNFLQLNFFSAQSYWGTKDVEKYHFNINEKSSFEEQKAFTLLTFKNKKTSYLDKVPQTISEIKQYERKWTLGLVGMTPTIGGGTTGTFDITKLPDGSYKRSFDYKTDLVKINPTTFNTKTARVTGRIEFGDKDFKKVLKTNLSVEYEVIDDKTEFKEMKSRIRMVNKLVQSRDFLKYTPEYYGTDDIDRTYLNLRFDLKQSGLDCLFQKIGCQAKGPKAYKLASKLKSIRNRNPIKQMEKLGPWLKKLILKPKKFKSFLQFLGGDKISAEFWFEGATINRDSYIHLNAESLNI